ncbi:hypothetical protein EVAR_24310_1 [Eumeta japonica]|uniref:Uncharacterized protein n=1 Tax=Eumeta variegata TaxID=151549 RepID=A0A4C1VLD7_EUMVA|nr:hypothetical protein EVAR_24310_1 [Eumeta japonica]
MTASQGPVSDREPRAVCRGLYRKDGTAGDIYGLVMEYTGNSGVATLGVTLTSWSDSLPDTELMRLEMVLKSESALKSELESLPKELENENLSRKQKEPKVEPKNRYEFNTSTWDVLGRYSRSLSLIRRLCGYHYIVNKSKSYDFIDYNKIAEQSEVRRVTSRTGRCGRAVFALLVLAAAVPSDNDGGPGLRPPAGHRRRRRRPSEDALRRCSNCAVELEHKFFDESVFKR